MRERAQAIIIRNNHMLFGYGKGRHFFIGGGVESGETPEDTILREIDEETNVSGEIIFKFESKVMEGHHTFLVDIRDQECVLGYDPEEAQWDSKDKNLQGLVWISLDDISKFTEIDISYIKLLYSECKKRGYAPKWLTPVKKISDLS